MCCCSIAWSFRSPYLHARGGREYRYHPDLQDPRYTVVYNCAVESSIVGGIEVSAGNCRMLSEDHAATRLAVWLSETTCPVLSTFSRLTGVRQIRRLSRIRANSLVLLLCGEGSHTGLAGQDIIDSGFRAASMQPSSLRSTLKGIAPSVAHIPLCDFQCILAALLNIDRSDLLVALGAEHPHPNSVVEQQQSEPANRTSCKEPTVI